MNKLYKKLAIYLTMGTIGAVTLTGCREKNGSTTESVIEVEQTESSNLALDAIEDNAKEGEVREYEPYEHLFRVRYYRPPDSGNSITIPEGYEVFTINKVSGSASRGYDIWFTNKDKVRVKAVYNEDLKKYDFSNFGEVLEVNDESLTKTK